MSEAAARAANRPRRPWSGLVADPKLGYLPSLLLALTVVTGLVDAVSILSLGRVFVANMTGNVVFIGFALIGAPGFSLSASLFALGGFLVGAFVGGVLIGRVGSDRQVLFLDAVFLELILVAVATAVAQTSSVPFGRVTRDSVAALLAIALGIQNAMARKLAVPDMTTTVLTMTLTGFAADIRARNQAALVRRAFAISAMFGGALLGAILVDHVQPAASLDVATGLIALVALMALLARRRRVSWG